MRCFVKTNEGIRIFNCSYNELPENLKFYPIIQYKTNHMSCIGYTALFNSNWSLKDNYNEKVKLIDPLKEKRYLNSLYLPDIVKDIFKIINFPNWEIASQFLELEKKLKEKNNYINFLKTEVEGLKKEVETLKEKITKRNRLIKKLRGNCQAIII